MSHLGSFDNPSLLSWHFSTLPPFSHFLLFLSLSLLFFFIRLASLLFPTQPRLREPTGQMGAGSRAPGSSHRGVVVTSSPHFSWSKASWPNMPTPYRSPNVSSSVRERGGGQWGGTPRFHRERAKGVFQHFQPGADLTGPGFPGTVVLRTVSDGSCLPHSLVLCL